MKAGMRRIIALDELRGLCLLLMVLYHGGYDLVNLYGVQLPLFTSPLMRFLQPFFAGVFVLLAGTTCAFSRSNLRRGVQALLCAAALTLTTLLVLPDEPIWFGILHLLGSCMLMFPLLRPLLDKLPACFGFAVCLLLFAVTWLVPSRQAGFFGLPLISLPNWLYTRPLLAAVGFAPSGFVSGDYFPILPWGFLFLAGSRIGHLLAAKGAPAVLTASRFPFLAMCGRHSLAIYLLHQPVLIALFTLIQLIRRNLFLAA